MRPSSRKRSNASLPYVRELMLMLEPNFERPATKGLPPRERPDEHEIADVRARDQEHEERHDGGDLERRVEPARAVEGRLPQRGQLDLPALVDVRVLRFEPIRDGGSACRWSRSESRGPRRSLRWGVPPLP